MFRRRTGAIKLNFPDLEVWELGESCALDISTAAAPLWKTWSDHEPDRERIPQSKSKHRQARALRDMSFCVTL